MEVGSYGGGNARQESYDVFADDQSINRFVIVQNTTSKLHHKNNQYCGLGIPIITVTHMARIL